MSGDGKKQNLKIDMTLLVLVLLLVVDVYKRQGFTCTMIQEINAMCSVINGGYYYQPHLVTKVKDSSGGIIKNVTPTLLKPVSYTHLDVYKRQESGYVS